MKKALSFILLLSCLIGFLASCSPDVKFEDVKYEENGIRFFLPNTMQRGNSREHDFYFMGRSMNVVFSAVKITDEFLEKIDLESGISAERYVDAIIERRELSKNELYYVYDKNSNQHNFRYNYVDGNEFETFFYVTVTGTSENLWYIEMCCPTEESDGYLEMFEGWRKTIATYS